MAASPRVVAVDTPVTWDGYTYLVVRGTIVDIPPGSALETAYGTGNLVSIGPTSAQVMSGDTEPLAAS